VTFEIEPVSFSAFAADLQVEAPESFDFDETKSPAETVQLDTSDLILRSRAKYRQMVDLSKVANAVSQIRSLPKDRGTLHAIMGGDFNGWDLIPAIHRLAKRPIRELIITTLGFNHKNIDQLCAMIDAKEARNVSILCSHYFQKADPDVYQEAHERLTKRNQRIAATRNHSKIILIDAGVGSYVVESSANLRTCNNIEQFALTRCRRLYKFHRAWIKKLLAEIQ
jgi:hypothetical protein